MLNAIFLGIGIPLGFVILLAADDFGHWLAKKCFKRKE
jgi:hypothetical protein